MAENQPTCHGTTKAGRRCRRPAGPSGYCSQHPPPAGVPPADFDDQERELWDACKSRLQEQGEDIDLQLLERYVRAIARARLGREAARKEPWVTGSMGQTVAHPGIALERQADRDAHDYALQLGLISPRAAAPPTDPDGGDPESKDPFDL